MSIYWLNTTVTFERRDTVSSIGFSRQDPLPGTMESNHVCFFRQALALDENRVKFLPEYVRGGASVNSGKNTHDENAEEKHHVGDMGIDQIGGVERVKEVWFAGVHSDMYVV